jgi:hypothetical protein
MPLPRNEAPVQEELPLITPKSKKRKKDKMCGLVISNLNSSFGAASPVIKRDNSLKLAETPRSSTPKTALFQTPKSLQAGSPVTPKNSTPVVSKILKGGKKPKLNKDTVKKMMKHEVKDNIRSFLMPMP